MLTSKKRRLGLIAFALRSMGSVALLSVVACSSGDTSEDPTTASDQATQVDVNTNGGYHSDLKTNGGYHNDLKTNGGYHPDDPTPDTSPFPWEASKSNQPVPYGTERVPSNSR